MSERRASRDAAKPLLTLCVTLGLSACGGNAAQDEHAQTADGAIENHGNDPT